MIVFLNGRYVDASKAQISVFDHGFLYADGVYETLRTYGGFVWQPAEHLRRLKRSAMMLGIVLPWSLRQVERWIDGTVARNSFVESRIRVTVTRGENNFDFGAAKKPAICIQVQKLAAQPAEAYKKGVDVVSFRGERVLPEAKTLNLLPMVLAQRFMEKKKAYEAFFVDGEDFVREGTVTNVFAVRKGVLMTPGKGILAGTTRDALLKLARRLGIKVQVRNMKLAEIFKADEVFVTNAPRGIVPVRSIDGKKIGVGIKGRVSGPVTQMLTKAFEEKIRGFVARERSRGVSAKGGRKKVSHV